MKFPSEKETLQKRESFANIIAKEKDRIKVFEHLLDYGFILESINRFSYYNKHKSNNKYKISFYLNTFYLNTDCVSLECKMINYCHEINRVIEVISFLSEMASYKFVFNQFNQPYLDNYLGRLNFSSNNKMFIDVSEFNDGFPIVYLSKTEPNQINVSFTTINTPVFPPDFDPKSNIFPINARFLPKEIAHILKTDY
jgi:hypothetical protein